MTNSGDTASEGPIAILDELPAGLESLAGVSGEDKLASQTGGGGDFSNSCGAMGNGDESCGYSGVVQPDDTLVLRFPVRVTAGGAGSVTNVVRVSGGGALTAGVAETPTRIAENVSRAKEETVFGLAPGAATTTLSSVQAGAHPDITTTGAFDTENAAGATVGAPKDIVADEPAGFALDLAGTPVCEAQLFLREECPESTQVGVTMQLTDEVAGDNRYLSPVYNLPPEHGAVAKIGFTIGTQYRYEGDVSVRPAGEPGEYGGEVTFYNASGGEIDYDGFSLTIWGVPAAAIHNPLRWKLGPRGGASSEGFFGASDPALETPYFTNPTSCGSGPLESEFSVTSWQHPNESPPATITPFGPIVGCDRLVMEPSLTAELTTDSASAPTGFDLQTSIPQTYESAAGVATSTLRREVVALPEGVTLNPSSAVGLEACSETQYAEEGVQYAPGRGCPTASKLASVKIKTPLLEEEAVGSVFLAESAPRGEAGKNPFGSLLAMYLVARIPNRGVLVKAPGKVQLNQSTGQIVTSFEGAPAFAGLPASEGLPPLPFSTATFDFDQGENAPLATPATCGAYTVTAALTEWSDPQGNPLVPSIPPFPIDANCPAGNVPPFNPGVTSYPIHGNAGAYSPFYLKITRNDGEQEITGFSAAFPPGLTGNLSGVTQCGEAEVQRARAQTGVEAETSPACPANSEIGYSIAEAGVGSVLAQTPGKIYLGGPYDGAPFSVVSVTAAHVGPFDLGTVVIHFPLDINPETADVTIPASPADVIPHIIKGIVVHVRTIRAYISRNDFMLNPTSCNPSALSATVLGNGASGNTVTVNDPFQVADCSSLAFAPKFAASTSGKTSKANGASLHVNLTYPANALGNDSNIKQVKVELPVQLPSRLTTLQKACTQAQFRANPAGCPAASLIGTAKAITPILPVALEGPVYFVSNGGEAFPNLIMVLQGDGVTIDLVGDTYISKTGITSSTFKAVPDQPVSSFELTLPEGKFSALAANGSLCAPTKTVTVKKKLTVRVKGKKKTETRKVKQAEPTTLQMPTEFVPQSGTAAIHQITTVSVTGCPRVHKAAKKAKSKKKRRKKR